MPVNRYAELHPIYSLISVNAASSTNPVQMSPIPNTPYRVDAMYASSTAAVAHDVRVQVYISAAQYFIGTVSVPAGAGYTNVPAVDLIPALIASPNDGLAVEGAGAIRATLAVTLGAGETLTITVVGGTI